MRPDIVAIGVCTRKRPNMLRACLTSLTQQIVPAGIAPQIIVVDNEAEPNARAAVEAFSATSPFPIHYVHQPQPGIPFARNAVLARAVEIGAGWIAFIDDDETADPDWIAELMAPEYRNTLVLMGFQQLIYPQGAFWAPPAKGPKYREGEKLSTAYTYNVRFAAQLAEKHRFNEAIGLGSGSDVEFFHRLAKAGAEIRFTRKAITRETVHDERVTYRGQCYRTFRNTLGSTRGYAERNGRGKAFARAAHFIPSKMVASVFFLGLGSACAPFSRRYFKKFALSGGKYCAQAIGFGAALGGKRIQPYRVVYGN